MITNFKIFENINKKTVDYNAIYVMNIHAEKNKTCNIIGKMIPKTYGALLVGYIKNREIKKIIYGKNNWSKIREATPEEINIYNSLEDIKKYNI